MPNHRVLLHQQGPALWPSHKPLAEVLELQKTTPPQIWSGTYQGIPSAPGGTVFKRAWWPRSNRYDITDRGIGNQIYGRYLSIDTALKDKDTSDHTAWTVGELWPDYRLGIRRVEQERLEFPMLPARIEELATRWNYDEKLRAIIIEDKASGTSALQTLAASSPAWLKRLLVPFLPSTDKVTRSNQAAVWCKLQCVLLPIPANDLFWLMDFEDELFNFPQVKHDDRTDSLSQLILYLEHLLEHGRLARGEVDGEVG